MYKRIGFTAALLTAGLISVAGVDRSPSPGADAALQRADADWDKGDYVAALTTYQELLAGPDAAAVLEPIALQTGELFRATELTTDGANPTFAPDSRSFSFETGPGVAAGVASGAARITHIRTAAAPTTDVTTLDGGEASFCPDGRRVAFLRVPASPELTRAQEAIALATTAAERLPRTAALTRLIARTGRIIVREMATGKDEEINTGDLLKAGVTCAADGAVLFAGALESETTATQIYLGRAGSAPQALTQGDGFKIPSKIDIAGRTLLFLVPNQGPFRSAEPPAAGGEGRGGGAGAGGGGGGGRGGGAAASFGGPDAHGQAAIVNGVTPRCRATAAP